MRLSAIIATVVLLVTGCSSSEEQPAAAPSTTASSTMPRPDPHDMLTATEVATAFEQAGLPVRNQRDNSANCETMQLGCLELMTTDDLSIMTFVDAGGAEQQKIIAAYGADAYSSGNVVLGYAAARTPAKLRPSYQSILEGLR